jgi:hypothetical protein
MDEGGRDQHSGAKMSRNEEEAVRDREFRETPGYDRENTCRNAEEEDEEEGEDVDWCVVRSI